MTETRQTQQTRSRRSRTFRVLVVCTGNACRSPLAEQLLDAVLSRGPSPVREAVRVSSAGTRATSGMPMDGLTASVSRLHGGAPKGHASRRMRADQLAAADLVLTMDREHRRAVVSAAPAAAPRTFLLTEYAALVADALAHLEARPPHRAGGGAHDDPAARLRAVVQAAARRRGLADLPDDAEIADPRGGTLRDHRRVGARIAAEVEALAATTADMLRRQAGPGARSVADVDAAGSVAGREATPR